MKNEQDEITINIAGGAPEPDRIVRRSEVARMLGRKAKTIDRLVSKGVLQKVTFPRCQRAAGFRLSDIQALIASGSSNPQGDPAKEEQQ